MRRYSCECWRRNKSARPLLFFLSHPCGLEKRRDLCALVAPVCRAVAVVVAVSRRGLSRRAERAAGDKRRLNCLGFFFFYAQRHSVAVTSSDATVTSPGGDSPAPFGTRHRRICTCPSPTVRRSAGMDSFIVAALALCSLTAPAFGDKGISKARSCSDIRLFYSGKGFALDAVPQSELSGEIP